jgi:hypothetical protein
MAEEFTNRKGIAAAVVVGAAAVAGGSIGNEDDELLGYVETDGEVIVVADDLFEGKDGDGSNRVMDIVRRGTCLMNRCTLYFVEEFDDEDDCDVDNEEDDCDVDGEDEDDNDEDGDENEDEDEADEVSHSNDSEDSEDSENSDSEDSASDVSSKSNESGNHNNDNDDDRDNNGSQASEDHSDAGNSENEIDTGTDPLAIGFQNPGSLCYLISVVTQLAAIPVLRHGLIELQLPYWDQGCVCSACAYQVTTGSRVVGSDATNTASSSTATAFTDISSLSSKQLVEIRSAAQLQLLFAYVSLLESGRTLGGGYGDDDESESGSCLDEESNILPFAKSIRDFASEKLSLHTQRDASDILLVILGMLHRTFKAHGGSRAPGNVYHGQLMNHIYPDVGSSSSAEETDNCSPLEMWKEELFYVISLEASPDISTLVSSLDHFVRVKQFPMSWQTSKDTREQLLTNKKAMFVSPLPNHLFFHIKRFEFDHVKMKTRKKNQYFSFPHLLDMTPYVLSTHNKDTESSVVVDAMRFRLSGVIIHEGTAQAGHYYSLVRQRGSYQQSQDRWLRIDDDEVTDLGNVGTEQEFDEIIGAESFGDGSSTTGNAFILVYDRL